MNSIPSQKELLELEQTNADGITFIESAARFLRCDLKELAKNPPSSEGKLRARFAPKEEIVLKLLLRRLSNSDDVVHEYFWTLLDYLIGVIPVKGLAHLLAEREFIESLEGALGKIVALKSGGVQDEQHGTFSDDESGRPIKKQKLRSSERRTSTEPGILMVLAWNTVAHLVELTTGSTESEEAARNAIRNVLSAEPAHAAAVTGKLLQLSQQCLALKKVEAEWKEHVDTIATILSIWRYRRPESVTDSAKSSDQCFTVTCLRPALRLLNELENLSVSPSAISVKSLERLIALHSILPARALFLAEKAQEWRTKTATITSHDFRDLKALAGATLLDSELLSAESVSNSESANILRYYSIAIRAVHRPTIRRIQQEQPWLDCLFCACAALGDPALPDMELDEANNFVVHASTKRRILKALSTHAADLFSLASEKAVKLSLPVLLCFTAAILQTQPDNEHWRLLSRILEQDANVLVPNAGLSQTTALLENILARLSGTNNQDPTSYPLARDGVVRPLLHGFAQARDLRGFVNLWLTGLQDAIQQRASGDLEYGRDHLCVIWEDNILFEDFEVATRALTTSTFARSLTAELLLLLQAVGSRIGPTSDIMAHTAIVTAVLRTYPEGLDVATTREIFTATVAALARRSDYQLQRWRLWRLLHQCFLFAESLTSVQGECDQLIKKHMLISLSTVSDITRSPDGYPRDARLKEALECFGFTVSVASKVPSIGATLFQDELNHLIELLSETENSHPGNSHRENGQIDTISTCIAMIVQQPQVLQHTRLATVKLIAAMIRYLSSLSDARNMRGLGRLVEAVLLSEHISTDTELFNDCCSAMLLPVDGDDGLYAVSRDILTAMPLQALKKPLAEKFADTIERRLLSDNTGPSALDQIMPDLGLLEMLVTSFSVSIGRPKNWTDFIRLGEHILARAGSTTSKLHQIASGCLGKMYKVLWTRCKADGMSETVLASLQAFQARFNDIEHPASPSADSLPLIQEGSSHAANPTHKPVENLEMSTTTNGDLEEIARRINLQASSLGSQKSTKLTKLVNQDKLNSQSLLLLSAIIYQASSADTAEYEQLLISMSKLATLDFALRAGTAIDLCLAMETCKIILEKHTSVVNQYTIDAVTSSIAALTSPNALQITSNNPSAIFDRLCAILGFLLARHRKRLGDRYHLVIPALQGLLRCLFFAGTSFTATTQTKSQVLFTRSLPSWVRQSPTALDPKSVEQFTRLLTTICDPSVSSVRRKKLNELTDETKKAKSLAGQHMQYVIMEFCRCSLHGRIPASSKEKLVPGLYAVLDVLDRETMRGMNGAMDSNGRAVWKGLYQDWERFGRWDRK